MRFPFIPHLRTEWKRWKGHWRALARKGRRTSNLRVEGLEDRPLMASITEYPIPAGTPFASGGLYGITGGPDGDVYFTDTFNNAIGRITPSGVITELPLPAPEIPSYLQNGLAGITLGADNKLAFTEWTQGAVGKITTSGSYNQYPIDSTGKVTTQEPDQITTAADGTLWWIEDKAPAIGELTPDGVVHEYTIPGQPPPGLPRGGSLNGITVGSDGNVWFTNVDLVGKITPSGVITTYPLFGPLGGTRPAGIVNGPDGNLWIADALYNWIDVMSTSGTVLHTYPVPPPPNDPLGLVGLNDITVGPDKNLYFTEEIGNVGEITTSGAITIIPVSTTVSNVPGASGPQPLAIASGPDGNIWFTDPVTDSIGVLRIVAWPPPYHTPTITWPAPAGIVYGTPLGPAQLDATASVPGTFTYTPNAGTVMHAGSGQTLSVTFTPADTADYSSVTKAVTINVALATPTIRWPAPVGILFGTPLGPGQLDANASVSGSFAYNPPAGIVLGIGNGQTLSVAFTPSDTTDYTDATATVTIDVVSGPQGPGHHGPTGGHLRTMTRVTAHPRSANVGASVILTATVKIVGSASGIPIGAVEFLDGSAALDTISLSAGTSSLVVSSLHPGRNAIRVHYLGTGDLPSSTSRAVVVTVQRRHSKAKHAGAHSRRISKPLGFTSGGAEEGGPAAIAAPLLADTALLGPGTSDRARRSHLIRSSPGPYPAGILSRTVHVPGVESSWRQVARQASPAALRGPGRLIDPE